MRANVAKRPQKPLWSCDFHVAMKLDFVPRRRENGPNVGWSRLKGGQCSKVSTHRRRWSQRWLLS